MGQNKVVGDFITLLRMVCSLKLPNCLFLIFSIYYFRPWMTEVTETAESETSDKGDTVFSMSISLFISY